MRGASMAFVVRVGGLVLAFLTHVLLIRWMSLEDYGIFAVVQAWATTIGLFTAVGLPGAALRFLPAYEADGDAAAARGFVVASRLLTLAVGVVAAVAAVAVAIALGRADRLSYGVVFALGMALVPLRGLESLQSEMIRASRRMVLAFGPSMVIHPSVLLIAAGGLRAWRGSLDSLTVVIAAILANGVSVVVQEIALRASLPAAVRHTKPVYHLRGWLDVALPMALTSGFQLMWARVDTIMLGVMAGPAATGAYNMVSKIARLVRLFLMAVNSMVAPMISPLFESKRKAELQRLLERASHAAFWPALALSVGLMVFGGTLLGWIRPELASSSAALGILVLGQLVSAATGPVGYLLGLTGHQRLNMNVFGVISIANAVLNALLIPSWGVDGAAFATSVTMIAWNVWLGYLVVAKLDLYSVVFGSRLARLAGGR